MSSTAIIPITHVGAKHGYVYLAKVDKKTENTSGCYKLGSTENLDKRMRALRRQYIGDITLIAYGFTNRRLVTEQYLHKLFVASAWRGVDGRHVFWWDKELYGFDENGLDRFCKVLCLVTSYSMMEHYSTPSTGELAALMKEKGGI